MKKLPQKKQEDNRIRFVVDSKDFMKNLEAVGKVINKRNTLPVLDNFLISVESDSLTVKASDCDMELSRKMYLENVSGAGKFLISPEIIKLLKKLPEQPIIIEYSIETLEYIIITENGKYSYVSSDEVENFPNFKEVSYNDEVEVTASDLIEELKKQIKYVASDELRPVMNAVYFEYFSDGLNLTASDEIVLRTKKLESTNRFDNFIVSKDVLTKLLKIYKNPNFFKFSVSEKQDEEARFIKFEIDNDIVKFREVEGRYPEYRNVIPTDFNTTIAVNKDDFIKTVDRMLLVANETTKLEKLNIEGNILTVSAQDIDFSRNAQEKIYIEKEGEDIEINTAGSYLLQCLSHIDEDNCVIKFTTSKSAFVYEITNGLILQMPYIL